MSASKTLAQIPPGQRDASCWHIFGAIRKAEIADLLKIPLGTIKTRMRQGLRLNFSAHFCNPQYYEHLNPNTSQIALRHRLFRDILLRSNAASLARCFICADAQRIRRRLMRLLLKFATNICAMAPGSTTPSSVACTRGTTDKPQTHSISSSTTIRNSCPHQPTSTTRIYSTVRRARSGFLRFLAMGRATASCEGIAVKPLATDKNVDMRRF